MDQENLIQEKPPVVAEAAADGAEPSIPADSAIVHEVSNPNQDIEPSAPVVTEVLDPQCGCGGSNKAQQLGYVYAVGELRPTFPSQSLEQEYNYAYEEFKAEGPPNALFYQVLSQGQNLYIAEKLCWVLSIQGVDSYIVKPRSHVELYSMVDALKPDQPGQTKFDVIIGPRGPVVGPEYCNGLQLPALINNHSYHFTFAQYVRHVADSLQGIPDNIVQSTLQQMLSVADNAGSTDAHRAINYLTVRSNEIYYTAWQMSSPDSQAPYPPGTFFLKVLEVRPSRVQGNRKIVDVIFQYESRDSIEAAYWYIKVDVSGQFPFLASRISRYYPAP